MSEEKKKRCPWCGSTKLEAHHFSIQLSPNRIIQDNEASEYECLDCGYFCSPEEADGK